VLEKLDTDEGVRIEESSKRLEIYISKSSSGIYAIQMTSGNSRKDDRYAKVEYLNSVYKVLSKRGSVFRKNATYFVY
jgi:hypothetical protein